MEEGETPDGGVVNAEGGTIHENDVILTLIFSIVYMLSPPLFLPV
jgi:hypothetical protein